MSESSDVAIKLLPPTSGEVQNTPITIMEIGSPEFLLRRRCFETALVKSMPNSPLAIHKRHEDDQMSRSICSVAVVKKEVTPSASIATCCDENRLRVIPRLEKCLSENSLFTGVKPESTDSQSSASKSEGDVRNPDVK
ncbi:hypothetical protein O3M35_001841 [Rhynocoris fuscipes]|uniref:Uncharacterized protein n=1 Tax=Rhynocoris fuscipes TaxID=488301 RepID=A0AAW1CS80_9HEMI